jgi:hypothetical protein
VALAGWALASDDFNLLVLAFPDISRSLNLSPTLLRLLGFIIDAASTQPNQARPWRRSRAERMRRGRPGTVRKWQPRRRLAPNRPACEDFPRW